MSFGFETTALEVVEGIDLDGKRAIVTGGASGIGIETARALASAGAEVTLAVRDVAAGERVATEVGATGGAAYLDLANLESVDAFARSWDGPLHILVNNAGVMALPELTLNADGLELQFATNHVGHFALAVGLHGALAAEGARIVSVSSTGHLRSPVVFDDLNFAFRDYEGFLAYGQSKTANVLFAVGATARWAGDGIYSNALMPGGIATALQRHQPPGYIEQARKFMTLKTPEQGAATSVLLATSPELDGIGGRYYEDCAEAPVVERRGERGTGGVAPYALDADNADRLWALSERLLGAHIA
jgi:NAD(P)-dependent dehydrogenase (short-subunit alcohol dehydrogenase family)